MIKYTTAVIGGGAAGICAAINLARRGEKVVICEKMPQLGKKILASGDGRCNLLNENLSEFAYNPVARELVRTIFAQFDKSSVMDFFQGLGLKTYSKEGRIFPITNQASSVLKVLQLELGRMAVPVELNFNCTGISHSGSSFLIVSEAEQKIECRKVIITGGGQTYPAFGSDGSTFNLARQLGHAIIDPVPAVVPLLVKDNLCQEMQGQRIFAAARSLISGRYGEVAKGELLFAKYGLSGTCILDISEDISIAINRHRRTDVFVSVDLVPFMDREQLRLELEKRVREKWSPEELLAGILPNKFSIPFRSLLEGDIESTVKSLKDRRFKVSGTRGWNEAEFTSGGISVDEVNFNSLESKKQKGIYFAGEVLDVNGKRGGYNLGWAWASGLVAGLTG
jgi:predicted Rossmann fold flavoprotein